MEQIGRFLIERELGRGGMGVVYAGYDPELDRRVALKLILQGAADPDALARFGREALALAKVRHPGVLQVFEVGRAPQGPFVVTALVEGETLTARLARGPLPAREAAPIVAALADAVAALHAAGLLHRDIKPANVMLRTDGTPVLLDFGLVRDESAEQLTLTGQLLGTPAYMSPEQANGERGRMGAPADVWSLGATLFALLTGHPPFDGQTVIELVHKVMFEQPDWRALARVAPPELVAVIRRALAKGPRARYSSAVALRLDLELWLAGKRPLAGYGQRVRRRRAAAAAGLAVAAAALLAAAALSSARPARDGADALAATPDADTPPPSEEVPGATLEEPWLALEAGPFLAALPEVRTPKDGEEVVRRCREWLAVHDHPPDGEVRTRLLASLLGRPPLATAKLAEPRNAELLALDAERVLVWHANDPVARWWSPGQPLPDPSWPLEAIKWLGAVAPRGGDAPELLAVGYAPDRAAAALAFLPTARGAEWVTARALGELDSLEPAPEGARSPHPNNPMRLACSPDGRLFAVGTALGEVAVYRWADLLAPGAEPLAPLAVLRAPGDSRAHRAPIQQLAFAGGGRALFSGSGALHDDPLAASTEATLHAWDLAGTSPKHAGTRRAGGELSVICPEPGPAGAAVVGLSGVNLLVRSSLTAELGLEYLSPGLTNFAGRQSSHGTTVVGAWLLAGGRYLLGAAGKYVSERGLDPRAEPFPAAELRAWNAANGTLVAAAELRPLPGLAFLTGALTPDGRRLITVSATGRGATRVLEVWDVDLGLPP